MPTLSKSAAGSTTGTLWTILNLSAAIILAIGGGIFRHVEKVKLFKSLTSSNVHLSENQQHLIRSLLSEPDHAKDILSQFTCAEAHEILPLFKNAFMQGYSSAMLLLFCISLAAFVLVFLVVKKKRLKVKKKN